MGLLIGGAFVAWALRGATAATPPTAPAAPVDIDALPDDPALVPYVLKVREMAYGWPGGVRPKVEGS
jgi:hypothetical protein